MVGGGNWQMLEIIRSINKICESVGPSAKGIPTEAMAFAAWDRCVDGVFADNVLPRKLAGRRLTAAVPNEMWRRNVADLGPAIADRINAVLGAEVVAFVEFSVEPDLFVERSARRKKAAKGDDVILVDPVIQEAAESIKDEGLRQIFLAAAAAGLNRSALTGSGPDEDIEN
jgi:hypothetical protein